MKSVLFCLSMLLIFLSSNEKNITTSRHIPLRTTGLWMGICPKGCSFTPGGKTRCSCPKKEYDPCANIKVWGGICPCGSRWENGKCISSRKTTKTTTRITTWLKSKKQN